MTIERNGWKRLSCRCWGSFAVECVLFCNLNSTCLPEGCQISVWLIFENSGLVLDVLFGLLVRLFDSVRF